MYISTKESNACQLWHGGLIYPELDYQLTNDLGGSKGGMCKKLFT